MRCWDDRAPGGLATSGSLVVSGSVWRGTGAQWTGDEPCQTPASLLRRTSAGQPWCLRRKTPAGPSHNSPTLRPSPAAFARRPDTRRSGHCAKQKDGRYEAPRTTSSCFGPAWRPSPGPSSPGWRTPRPQPRRSSSGRRLPSSSERLWGESSPERSTPCQTEEDAPELSGQSLRRTCPAPLRSLRSGCGRSPCQSPWGTNLKWNSESVDLLMTFDPRPCISVTVNKWNTVFIPVALTHLSSPQVLLTESHEFTFLFLFSHFVVTCNCSQCCKIMKRFHGSIEFTDFAFCISVMKHLSSEDK